MRPNRPQFYPTADEIQAFWANVFKSPTGCWHWIGSFNSKNYGQLQVNGKRVATHRLSWIIRHGFVPHGLFVCHKCDVKSCVNPDHLFLGTPLDNTRDFEAKNFLGRLAAPKRAFLQKPEKIKPSQPDFSPRLVSPFARPHGTPIPKSFTH